MSKITISQDLKSKRLTNDEKDKLFKLLKKKSGLEDRLDKLTNNVSTFLETILVDNILDAEFFDLFTKSKRISVSRDSVTINGSNVFKFKEDYFPNSKIGGIDFDKKTQFTIRMYDRFKLNINIPTELSSIEDWVDQIPENKLEVLKDLLIELYIERFKETNFLSEFHSKNWKHDFLPSVSTWGQLYKFNYDWFEILYNESIEKGYLTKEFIGLPSEDEIKNTLLDLKVLLGVF